MPVPTVAGDEVAAACAALVEALPDEVDPGVERREVTGDGTRTAAWGDPPVTLECGVEPPERAEQPIVVNGVGWTTRDIGPGFRWTTYGRSVYAAVTVPDAYENGIELIYPFAEPVEQALPADPSAPPLVPPS